MNAVDLRRIDASYRFIVEETTVSNRHVKDARDGPARARPSTHLFLETIPTSGSHVTATDAETRSRDASDDDSMT
ncbi:unnamed protein product [Lota lota]